MKEICSLNDAAHFQVERLILHVLLPIKCEHGLCTADNFAIVCSIFPNLIKVYLICCCFSALFCHILFWSGDFGWFGAVQLMLTCERFTHISNLIIFSVLFFFFSSSLRFLLSHSWLVDSHVIFTIASVLPLVFFSNTMLKYNSILYPPHSMCSHCSPWTRFFPVRIILMWAHQEYYV